MSEPGPDSVPTSADPRSRRPLKRRAVSPRSEHATQVDSLFRDPKKALKLPDASKPKSASSLPAPPEIVANVQGSSAGAGSGEFHVYKASRRREYERLRLMQDEVDQEKAQDEWQREREETRRKDEERTEKNRKRRDKRRAAKKNNPGKPGEPGALPELSGGGSGKGTGVEGEGQGGSANGVDQSAEMPGVIIHED